MPFFEIMYRNHIFKYKTVIYCCEIAKPVPAIERGILYIMCLVVKHLILFSSLCFHSQSRALDYKLGHNIDAMVRTSMERNLLSCNSSVHLLKYTLMLALLGELYEMDYFFFSLM